MEGYLLLKEQSGGLLNRSAWVTRWVVLDKTAMTKYESFDDAADRPGKQIGDPISVEGCDVRILPKDKYEFLIEICPPTAKARPNVQIRADNDLLCTTWHTALTNAAVGAPPDLGKAALKESYLELGLLGPCMDPIRAEAEAYEAFSSLLRAAEETRAPPENVERLKDAYLKVSGASVPLVVCYVWCYAPYPPSPPQN